ncbi:uncharacterized protein N7443_003502 [Penicillium atrosanguineum]|uniref:uncharacterized protein n=1 Tax=Penicillium atrosanguineum TaxID=1132637 RepID=UPI0023864D86|nr:uncharacterized protein N7443_003502 [Penicillium atrosanguineum]KAJ5303842.1 hypothetical protein N7443_003502 [Penicillium atrosanguineum]
MAKEASLTFPLVLLSVSFVFTVYLNRQVIKKALQDCGNLFSRYIHKTQGKTCQVICRTVCRIRQCFARRRPPGQNAEYELLDMSSNTAAVVDAMEPEYTSEPESSSTSIYNTESKESRLHSDIIISDSSSSDSQDDKIYSPRARHRLSTHNIDRGTNEMTPQITSMAWEIEHARRMQQGGPSTWLHQMVDWTVERVQVSFEASNPINQYASYIRHEEEQEGSVEHVE